MEKEKKPKHFIQQPEFPGGPKELTKFIYSNLKYPAIALKEQVEGTVIIEYDIDYKGNVVDTRVLQSLGHGCDEEAARVIRLLKFAVGRNRGVKVMFHQKAHIRFKMPPAPAPAPTPPATVQVQYNYVAATPAAEPAAGQPKTESTYQYTITINPAGKS